MAGRPDDRIAREEPEPSGVGQIVPPGPVPAAGAAAAGRALPPGPWLGAAHLASRYAGAMLLHAFFDQAQAGTVLAGASGRPW